MELRELRSLVVLSEVGSITKTAEKLNLSAAAIHKQLKMLESELGVQLYERVGRQLRLTQAAEIIIPHIKNLFTHYDASICALKEWKGLKGGVVRIGSVPTMSSYMLPSLLENFRRKFPDVELSIETGTTPDLAESLSRGAIDLAFLVSLDQLEPQLVAEATWDFEMVFVSGKQQFPRRCRAAEMQGFPFILYKEDLVFNKLIVRYFAEVGFNPRVIMRFDNAEAIKAMIRLGLGISMLPRWTLSAELKNRMLSLIQQKEAPLLAKIVLVTRKTGYVPQPVEAFLKVARDWQWKSAGLISR